MVRLGIDMPRRWISWIQSPCAPKEPDDEVFLPQGSLINCIVMWSNSMPRRECQSVLACFFFSILENDRLPERDPSQYVQLCWMWPNWKGSNNIKCVSIIFDCTFNWTLEYQQMKHM